jgi:hypothetical protein
MMDMLPLERTLVRVVLGEGTKPPGTIMPAVAV